MIVIVTPPMTSSHTVMSGFTTGAAMSIGLSQIKNAFGFYIPKGGIIPQQGSWSTVLNAL